MMVTSYRMRSRITKANGMVLYCVVLWVRCSICTSDIVHIGGFVSDNNISRFRCCFKLFFLFSEYHAHAKRPKFATWCTQKSTNKIHLHRTQHTHTGQAHTIIWRAASFYTKSLSEGLFRVNFWPLIFCVFFFSFIFCSIRRRIQFLARFLMSFFFHSIFKVYFCRRFSCLPLFGRFTFHSFLFLFGYFWFPHF